VHCSIVGAMARLSLDRNSKYSFVKYIINGRLKEGWTTLIFRSYVFCACATIDNPYFSMSEGPGFASLLDNLHIDGPSKARITITRIRKIQIAAMETAKIEGIKFGNDLPILRSQLGIA